MRRGRQSRQKLTEWPDATGPAEYLGAEAVEGGTVMRWRTLGGYLGLVWPLPGVFGVEYFAARVRNVDQLAVLTPFFGIDGPEIKVVAPTAPEEMYEIGYADLRRVLGMPAPFFAWRLCVPELIQAWSPGSECMDYPVIPDVDIAPILRLAVMYHDEDAAFRVLVNFARTAQAGPVEAAESDIRIATEGDAAAPEGTLTVAARPLPVPPAADLGEGLRRLGWLSVLARTDALAEQCIRRLIQYNFGRELPFGGGYEVKAVQDGPGAEWVARLEPVTTRTAAFALVERNRGGEPLIDPATDAPVMRERDGTYFAAACRRLPTTSSLAQIILDEQIWIRVQDGTVYLAPQHASFGLGWGYRGSGPGHLASLAEQLLDDITAAPGDHITAGIGMLALMKNAWPQGTILTREQLEVARQST